MKPLQTEMIVPPKLKKLFNLFQKQSMEAGALGPTSGKVIGEQVAHPRSVPACPFYCIPNEKQRKCLEYDRMFISLKSFKDFLRKNVFLSPILIQLNLGQYDNENQIIYSYL